MNFAKAIGMRPVDPECPWRRLAAVDRDDDAAELDRAGLV